MGIALVPVGITELHENDQQARVAFTYHDSSVQILMTSALKSVRQLGVP